MKKDSSPEKENGASRRLFLQTATVAGGALILGRGALAQDGTPAETVLKLDEHEALQKVGGFEIVEIDGKRVIVAHTETGFTACSAICPHKGCEVEYRLANKDFYCPCHRSRFDESGKVLQGPAKTNLAPYDAAQALIVKGK
jgi:cytochrome b6-f complex iron-sulfur subunit